MNKAYLKSFYGKKKVGDEYKADLEYKCFEYEGKYLISNKYSMVLLNSTYNLLEITENGKANFCREIFNKFRYEYNLNVVNLTNEIPMVVEGDVFNFKEEYASDIKERDVVKRHGVNIKYLKNLVNLINADKIHLLTGYDFDYEYIVEVMNTATGEIGYLLPVKVY